MTATLAGQEQAFGDEITSETETEVKAKAPCVQSGFSNLCAPIASSGLAATSP